MIDACLFQVLLSTNYSIWFLRELCVNEEEEEGAGIPLFFFLSKQGAGEHKRSFFL